MKIPKDLHEALLDISLDYKVVARYDDEDNGLYDVILFKPNPGLTPKESFEAIKRLYKLSSSKDYLITEDF
jgi:hypothetical protein